MGGANGGTIRSAAKPCAHGRGREELDPPVQRTVSREAHALRVGGEQRTRYPARNLQSLRRSCSADCLSSRRDRTLAAAFMGTAEKGLVAFGEHRPSSRAASVA